MKETEAGVPQEGRPSTFPSAYKPPFIYFGGKSKAADVVWAALGDVQNYVEPFFGTGAVLFLRPTPPRTETVNDADGFVANFWRALQSAPEHVAQYAGWPVNEADLTARHLWLLGQREVLTERLMADPFFFDARVAGWWVWGINLWIGSGWCSGNGSWRVGASGVLEKQGNGGIQRQRPHLTDHGQGIHRWRQCRAGAKSQSAADSAMREQSLRVYCQSVADRLRSVRVCCGDWHRICGPAVTFRHGVTGVFLDPPYAVPERCLGLYAVDSLTVAHRVREWALANGQRRDMRIVLAGYAGEHVMPDSWRIVKWKVSGAGDGRGLGVEHRHRERLWLSPHCLDIRGSQLSFFAEDTGQHPHG